jgi:hypothetical protein
LVPTEDTLGACFFGWLLIGKKLFESAKIKCFFRFSIAKKMTQNLFLKKNCLISLQGFKYVCSLKDRKGCLQHFTFCDVVL